VNNREYRHNRKHVIIIVHTCVQDITTIVEHSLVWMYADIHAVGGTQITTAAIACLHGLVQQSTARHEAAYNIASNMQLDLYEKCISTHLFRLRSQSNVLVDAATDKSGDILCLG
jgi:hypothetical protein